jgi:type IV fimbrial biogenesis protein FimT
MQRFCESLHACWPPQNQAMNALVRSRRCASGVTLVELLFSLGLLALLAGLAAPGFRESLRSAAVRSATFELAVGLQQARANSILESRPGLLCPTDALGNCLGSGAIASGWRSFLEGGKGRVPLASHDLPRGVVLRATRSPLHFWPSSLAASTGTLTICDQSGVAPPRAIVLSATGRARVDVAPAAACES